MVTAKKPAAKRPTPVAKKATPSRAAAKIPAGKQIAKTAVASKSVTTRSKRLEKLLTEPVAINNTFNQTELLTHLVEVTSLDKKDVAKVLAALKNTMLGSLMPRAVGEFTLHGMLKVFLRKVPARRAGVLVRNPGTGEMVKGKAKPASVRVKLRPLIKMRQAALG